ncbi:hypothetical protein RintRC_0147 [Richelia intracellularis]|nr:hypothetical protein RintRC_0147 [Richelia intracellularis]
MGGSLNYNSSPFAKPLGMNYSAYGFSACLWLNGKILQLATE